MNGERLKQWLEYKLRVSFNLTDDDTLRIEMNSSTIGGTGFLSDSYRLKIHSNVKVPERIFVKVPNTEKLRVWNVENIEKVIQLANNTECEFYTLFQGIPGICKAFVAEDRVEEGKFSGDGPNGVLVMECHDAAHPALTGTTIAQMRSMLDTIAAVQVASLDLKINAKLDRLRDNWQHFTKLDAIIYTKPWFDYLRTAYPHLRLYLDKLTHFEKPGAVERLTVSACEDLGIPQVLCHCDIHSDNMLYNRLPDGSAGDTLVSLIDWQLSHMGLCTTDFACLTMLLEDFELVEDLLVEFHQKFVTHWHKRFSAQESPITLKQFRAAFVVSQEYAVLELTMMLRGVLTRPDTGTSLLGLTKEQQDFFLKCLERNMQRVIRNREDQ